MINMDSSDTSKLWQTNSKNFRQNQDNTEWEIVILEKRDLLIAQLQTNVKDSLDIVDFDITTSCYGGESSVGKRPAKVQRGKLYTGVHPRIDIDCEHAEPVPVSQRRNVRRAGDRSLRKIKERMPPECEEIEIRDILEKNDCVERAIPKKSLKLCILCGHCTMVNKLWYQEIGRRWRQAIRQEPPQARALSEPKCQPYVAIWYLSYRWIIFFAWVAFVVCSVFEFGSYKPLQQHEKWPIYLTNWDMALGLTQALIGGILVSKRWRLQKILGFDPCDLKLESVERLYWFLYVVTTNMAIGVTVCYWFAVYNPEIHQVDPLNIMMHVCNSVLMLIDLFVTSIPFRLQNFWWCLSIVLFYVIFSMFYYIAGGLDKYGYHYIYKILDWKKPVRTSLVCIGGFMFVTVLHCIVCILANIRDCIYRKIAKKYSKSAHINMDDKPLPEKQVEVV